MRNYFLITVLAVFFVACDQSRFFEQNQEIPNQTWNYQNKLKFDVAVEDTLTPYNFLFNLRHNEAYPYSNFYFFFHTYFPNGKIAKDTVHCILSDQNGKWLGTHAGDIIDNQILFKYQSRFPISGTYHFEIEQAMREENLPNVLDAGLRIEYTKK